jgi:type II secretory pathway component PulC
MYPQECRMNKWIVLILIIAAVLLYSYNTLLLVGVPLPGKKEERPMQRSASIRSFEQLLVAATPPVFEKKGRDPFTLYIEKPKPLTKVKTSVVPQAAPQPPQPPPISLTGILWNSSNPVATIVLQGGTTKLVRQGQVMDDGSTIRKIDKNFIVVEAQGKEFVLRQQKK